MCDFQERKKNSPKYLIIFRRQSHCQMTRESVQTCDIQLFHCNDGVDAEIMEITRPTGNGIFGIKMLYGWQTLRELKA